ncbi:FtsW/RodA/SpoVE family cell cycle protein [Actinotalea ferrariae]|uniref:FtsW/RodA/SpoVE family cell cycle protein n=1 Tax=Actinotalea ferrariae TaxID=1386098 RepID=UPI001C8BF24A|nr:FtsW/RodA/SpoVE family cell cycle protein [Actinotalea ferrariae]MBX9245439.1 FtsW/RodA/SpoVE family cell cycle protein [Actinotalea ferrariae]
MATVAPHRVRPGRSMELGLLVLALAIGVSAYALVGLATAGTLPADIFGYSAGLVGLSVGLHLVMRWRAPYADPVILPVAVALNGIGLAMIYRIDIAETAQGENSTFAERQLGWTALGIVLAAVVIVLLRDHRTLRRYTYTAMVAGLALIVLPLVPGLGAVINGARIWIRVGGYSFQPAEFGKIALAVFFAGYLVTTRDTLALAGPKVLGLQLPRPRDLGPILLAWAVSLAVLVLERDLGTSLLFFGLFVAMLYLATERLSWIVIGMGLFVGGAVLASRVFSHVGARFDAWLNAFDDDVFNASPGGSGQLVRGLFGMANGGLFGTGWGQGRPDLVPYAESDFIIASLGEELGLTGLLAILVLYLVLAQRGLRTAIGVRDGFGKLFAGGMAFVVAFQCFVVVGGVTRLIPLTGLTMPFLAYGGSSLLANWVIAALLLRISDSARRPAGAESDGRDGRGSGAPPADDDVATGDDNVTEVITLDRGRR